MAPNKGSVLQYLIHRTNSTDSRAQTVAFATIMRSEAAQSDRLVFDTRQRVHMRQQPCRREMIVQTETSSVTVVLPIDNHGAQNARTLSSNSDRDFQAKQNPWGSLQQSSEHSRDHPFAKLF